MAALGIPQLRIRTEFSFRQAFGPLPAVAEALKATACPIAGVVDPGTWGHVRWAAALAKAGIRPAFGTEVVVPQEERRPVAFCLAAEMPGFYEFSTAIRRDDADVPALLRKHAKSLVRFAGAGLSDPSLIDYIDVNPESPLATARGLALAKKTGKPVVITSANYYPTPADKGAFLAMGGRERTTPQHILSLDELKVSLSPLFPSARAFDRAVRNTFEAAERTASALPTAPLIKIEGDFAAVVERGRKRRLKLGHLAGWSTEYDERLKREMALIVEKKYESYFLVVADLVQWAKTKMLVGPGRGSSAGSLLCYLVGITEVDPIPHGLLFERFVDLNRSDLPDIDIDFSDTKRDLVFTYLREKYGASNVARIGNVSTMKARSVLAEICKRFAIPDHDKFNLLNVLVEYSSGDARYGKGIEDTLATTDVGKAFTARYPESLVMTELENHAWHTSIHAAGVIVSMEPVSGFCTIGPDGVAQIDKPDVEVLNLLKIDALGLRTLGIIEDSGVVTQEQLYAMKLDDKKVFDIFNKQRYSAVFQFEGNGMSQVGAHIHVDDFRTIDNITALARPGPLGGGAAHKYISRKAGREPISYTHPSLEPILKDTYGVVLYQEQVMRIVREIGKFSWEDTTVIRKAMSGRKGKEYFDAKGDQFFKGAAQDNISLDNAREIWNEIFSFGAWGFNRSHSVAYGVISYWCAWLKTYHPLEYAAACLRSAKDDEHALTTLRDMDGEGIEYVPFDIERSEENWSVKDGKLLGGFINLEGIGMAKASAAVAARKAGTLDCKKFLAMKVKFDVLYPLRSKYRDLIADPEAYGCSPGSRVLTANQFPEEGDVLYIGRITKKRRLDQNEQVRIAKRNGRRLDGPTLEVDFIVKDDVSFPVICRVGRFQYEPAGRAAMEQLSVGDDVLIRGSRVRNYQMLRIIRIKCLNKEGIGFEFPQRRKWRN